MTISVTPKFTLEIADDDLAEAAGQVTPTRWNDGSEITMSSGKVIGRMTAGDGPAEEITLGTAASKDTGTSSGNVPVLDGSGKLDTSILPAVAITDVFVVASQSAMLALTAEKGDLAIRSDLNKTFALSTNSPSTLTDWKELLTPTDAVLSVAGLTGAISGSGLKTALAIAVADITDASANGRSLISAANYAAMKALLDLEIGTDVQAYDADTAYTDVAQNFTAPQRTAPVALTSGSTITINLADGNDRTLTLAHNATISNPSDIASYVGQKGSIAGVQNGTGGGTLSMGNQWYPVGGSTMPAIPSGANNKWRIDYHVVSSTRIDFSVAGVGV